MPSASHIPHHTRHHTRQATSGAPPKNASVYIVSAWYDWLFFIGSPLIAILIVIGAHRVEWMNTELSAWGIEESPMNAFIGALIMAHLFAVFFRSHLNPQVRREFKLRFFLIPPLLIFAMTTSLWVTICCSALATWWDVYHSSLQTFGLGRLYDARAHNDPHSARRLDIGLNLVLYIGPILGGVTLMDHVDDFKEFEEVGATFFTAIPAQASAISQQLTYLTLTLGISYLAYYLYAYARLARSGYKISYPKVALFVITGISSLLFWGFNTFGEAFFVMNFFHAVQYFALVWWAERRNLTALSARVTRSRSEVVSFALFIGMSFTYGVWAELSETTSFTFAIMLTVSLLHFWYDGFIWSVRKRAVMSP